MIVFFEQVVGQPVEPVFALMADSARHPDWVTPALERKELPYGKVGLAADSALWVAPLGLGRFVYEIIRDSQERRVVRALPKLAPTADLSGVAGSQHYRVGEAHGTCRWRPDRLGNERRESSLPTLTTACRKGDNGVMSDQPEDWEDLEAWEAELEGLEPGLEDGKARSKRSWRGIIWVVLALTLLAFIWYVWVAALLNPDNYRLPVTPTPPVTPWEQGDAPFDLEAREDVGSLVTLGFLLPSLAANASPDDLESDCAGQACVGGGGQNLQPSERGTDVIAGQSGDTSAWLALWIGTHVFLQAVGLVTIARRRHKMGTRLVVKWTLLILLVPVAGVLGYYFYLLEGTIHRGVPGRREEAASFLRSPLEKA